MRFKYILSLLLAGSFGCFLETTAQTLPVKNNELVLPRPVTFKVGSTEITEDGLEVLNEVKEYLKEKSYISLLRIEGHVAASEDKKAQLLSEQRALAVCKWLVSNGVECKRLLPVGFGKTKPVSDIDGSTRISFVNAALKGRPIGGMPVDGGGKVAGEACK